MRASRLPIVAALVASVLLAGSPPAATRAAEDVDFRAQTRYLLRPAEGRIEVVIDAEVTNETPDRGRIRFFYTGYKLAIEKQAVAVTASAEGRRLDVKSQRRPRHTEVSVSFGENVFRGETFRFRVKYQLPGAKPRSPARTRVGRAYAAFYAYAQGDEDASVRILVPKGFEVDTEGSTVQRQVARDGSTVLLAARISRPATWWVWVSADRPSALRVDSVKLRLDRHTPRVEVQSWPEDRLWRASVTETLEDGLPVLAGLVGLDWPLKESLEVVEVHAPLLGVYDGLYDAKRTRIELSEEMHGQVTLHEASHVWFDRDLFRERWITEGLAESYAAAALGEIGGDAAAPPRVGPDDEEAFPLNEWRAGAATDGEQDEEREEYGYKASWTVLDELLDEIGAVRMRLVIRAAHAEETPYVGEGPPERLPGSVDWRRFLDLLEERGGSKRASELFERWVVDPYQRERLEQRRKTREEYASLGADASGWAMPYLIRHRLSLWDFQRARQSMDDAREVLDRRRQVEGLASSLGIAPSRALEHDFEQATAGFETARKRADEQLTTLGQIERATRVLTRERDLVVAAGLWGETPEARLTEAGRRFAAEDLAGARAEAAQAVSVVEGARARGTERIATAAGAGGTSVLLLGGGLLLLVRRRHRRAAGTVDARSSDAAGSNERGHESEPAPPATSSRDDVAAPSSEADGTGQRSGREPPAGR